MTIQQAIDTLIAAVPGAPFPETVDTVKVGDTSQELIGILVCFLANADLIKQAAAQGANLIVAHEPLFYNHLDKTDWLANDAVYAAKRNLLADLNVVVWRFHDYLHSIPPDATVMGLMNEMGWKPNGSGDDLVFTDVPATTLAALAQSLRQTLGLSTIRVVGDLNMPIRRVGIMPGSPPTQYQVEVLRAADVLIAGEINEWETNEWTRDANLLGQPKGLIVIGHAASEEPGMRLMTTWIEKLLPGVPVQFVPAAHAFHYL